MKKIWRLQHLKQCVKWTWDIENNRNLVLRFMFFLQLPRATLRALNVGKERIWPSAQAQVLFFWSALLPNKSSFNVKCHTVTAQNLPFLELHYSTCEAFLTQAGACHLGSISKKRKTSPTIHSTKYRKEFPVTVGSSLDHWTGGLFVATKDGLSGFWFGCTLCHATHCDYDVGLGLFDQFEKSSSHFGAFFRRYKLDGGAVVGWRFWGWLVGWLVGWLGLNSMQKKRGFKELPERCRRF